MMDEPDLFAYARNTDPATSHMAAESIVASLPMLEFAVLGALKTAGAKGRTIDELVDELGLDKVTISPRLRPLCRKNLARETDDKRPGKSNRLQTVWRAT